MKLHMMTHGDAHQYEEEHGSNVHNVYTGSMPSPYYNAEYQRHAGYSGKYFESPVENNMLDASHLQTTTMSCTRSEMTPASYSECDSTNSVNEDMLLRVAEEQLRPLIKEELRYTIQSKRAAKGLPSHVEIEYKVSEPEPDTPATVVKRQRRRERNKIAAAKCRFKKKILSEQLVEESEVLENQNQKLKTEVQRLQEERQKLIFILNLHRPTCIVRSPSCSSPPLDFSNQPTNSCSPSFEQPCSQSEQGSSSFHRLSPGSRSSSHDDDSLSSLTSTFTYPPYSSSNELTNTPVHRSVIVQSRSTTSLSKQS